jgi:cytochrome c oxidase cbb3-type subunit 3
MAEGKDIDAATGTAKVGHEWDGIEELDTPLPRWWVILFGATIVFAAGYVIAYPAVPDSQGALGWSSHGQLAATMAAEAARRAPLVQAIAATPIEQLPANPKLLHEAVEAGKAAFKINCVQCHGAGATGARGYPSLADDDWLWGGDLKAIEYTITHGVRNADDDATRLSQMPAFGEILSRLQIAQLVAHVRVISGQDKPSSASAAGAALFAENCASCHGPDGKGNREFGAPNLTDAIWLYGGDKATLTTTISKARYGVMPRWNARLDPATIRMLAAYVHSLGGGEAAPPTQTATAEPAHVGT